MNARFFDLDTLISVNGKVWIVDKNNPNIPILKVLKSDFNLMKSGIYKSQGNRVDYNGQTFWLPTTLFNQLKVKLKIQNINLGNIGISMKEFIDKDIIKNAKYKIDISLITNSNSKADDIYVICSKQNKDSYQVLVNELEIKLRDIGISIKNFYFISETFYNQNDDDIKYSKIKLLLQHLVGYKTSGDNFIDEEISRYETIHYYDNNLNTQKIADEANIVLKSILNRTENGLSSVVKEDIVDYPSTLIVNQVTDNEANKMITKKVIIEYSNLIKTFESFLLLENLKDSEESRFKILSNFFSEYSCFSIPITYPGMSEEERNDRIRDICRSDRYLKIKRWVDIFPDIFLALIDIVDKGRVRFGYSRYDLIYGIRDIDCLSFRIKVSSADGFDNNIHAREIENALDRISSTQFVTKIDSYDSNSRHVNDNSPIYYSTTVSIFFAEDLGI